MKPDVTNNVGRRQTNTNNLQTMSVITWYTLAVLVAYAVANNSAHNARVRTVKSNAVTQVISIGDVNTNDVDVRLTKHDVKSSLIGLRFRRTVLSGYNLTVAVTSHNILRRKEGASNMQYMTWNSILASMADGWAKRCDFRHGQVTMPAGGAPYDQLGQNLIALSGAPLDVKQGIQDWYDEKQYYNFDTMGCQPGQQCGHYTQVVWSSSREVGCAIAFCPVLGSTDLTNADYMVCNYGPAGNYVGNKPYKKGSACTQCDNGIGWCDSGLCRQDCTSPGPNCQCAAVCYNCGTIVSSTCKCSCAQGWTGPDCSAICQDTNANCNANPGWPPSWCNHAQYGPQIRSSCPAMCNLCERRLPSDPAVTCVSSSASSIMSSTTSILVPTPPRSTTVAVRGATVVNLATSIVKQFTQKSVLLLAAIGIIVCV